MGKDWACSTRCRPRCQPEPDLLATTDGREGSATEHAGLAGASSPEPRARLLPARLEPARGSRPRELPHAGHIRTLVEDGGCRLRTPELSSSRQSGQEVVLTRGRAAGSSWSASSVLSFVPVRLDSQSCSTSRTEPRATASLRPGAGGGSRRPEHWPLPGLLPPLPFPVTQGAAVTSRAARAGERASAVQKDCVSTWFSAASSHRALNRPWELRHGTWGSPSKSCPTKGLGPLGSP